MNFKGFRLAMGFGFVLSLSAHAGFNYGNGSDRPNPVVGSAWFVGDRTVHACVQTDLQFPVTKSKAESDFRAAWSLWQQYVILHKVDHLAMNLVFDASCNGGQDLTVFLGVTNANLEKDRRRYSNPNAYVERTHHDAVSGWSRGYMWVAPSEKDRDWSVPRRLGGIFLHEIGHLLGNDHVAGTIMRANVDDYIFPSLVESQEQFWPYYERIDQERELGECVDCEWSMLGKLGEGSIFKQLIGREPGLAARATLKSRSAIPGQASLSLELEDEQGKYSLPLYSKGAGVWLFDLTSIFHRFLPSAEHPNLHHDNYSSTSQFVMKLPNGKNRTVLLIYNALASGSSPASPYVLYLMDSNSANLQFLFAGLWQLR
ncbi:MAG: hypothetical protein JST16_16045 [Bdellovibrionales bacterium]|nr:hypothetical protein [Bdellovibrionales bacterium]